MKKRLISIVMSILMTLITAVSCGKFELEPAPRIVYGDVVYCYVDSADSNFRVHEADYIAILGLSEEGSKKKTIIIPETIEDRPVILIGMERIGRVDDIYGKYDKIYLPNTLQNINGRSDSVLMQPKVFFSKNDDKAFNFIFSYTGWCTFHVSFDLYDRFKQVESAGGKIEGNYTMANLTYIVDEEVYWIDDYEEGEYVTFPQTPQKEGYTFDGWYREPDYLTKWNEETDAYSKPEDVKTVKLYAKWIENK